MADADDGWHDPTLRKLRAVAIVVVLALLAWVVVVDASSGSRDLAATGTLGGMLLVMLGFEALVRWPR